MTSDANTVRSPFRVPRSKVLVVDDEEANRMMLGDLLEAAGCEVLFAEHGREAIEKVLAELPDAVLLDIVMPVMDGYEVCRRLKADSRSAAIPIIMITSMGNREARIQGVAAGADDLLQKPVDHEELILRVRNAVHRKRLYDELQAKYEELRAMAELHKSLTSIIDADTETLSSMMSSRTGRESPQRGTVGEGGEHGAN